MRRRHWRERWFSFENKGSFSMAVYAHARVQILQESMYFTEQLQIPEGGNIKGQNNPKKVLYLDPYFSEIGVTIKLIQIKAEILDNVTNVSIMIDDKERIVDPNLLMSWSKHFQRYFQTDMIEKNTGKYMLKDIEYDDFDEMIEVISPYGRAISYFNVEKMLHLADRFIMPALTRKCEIFLYNHFKLRICCISNARLFYLSTKYRLQILTAMLIHHWRDETLFRSELLEAKEYDELDIEVKNFVNLKFVEFLKKSFTLLN